MSACVRSLELSRIQHAKALATRFIKEKLGIDLMNISYEDTSYQVKGVQWSEEVKNVKIFEKQFIILRRETYSRLTFI